MEDEDATPTDIAAAVMRHVEDPVVPEDREARLADRVVRVEVEVDPGRCTEIRRSSQDRDLTPHESDGEPNSCGTSDRRGPVPRREDDAFGSDRAAAAESNPRHAAIPDRDLPHAPALENRGAASTGALREAHGGGDRVRVPRVRIVDEGRVV